MKSLTDFERTQRKGEELLRDVDQLPTITKEEQRQWAQDQHVCRVRDLYAQFKKVSQDLKIDFTIPNLHQKCTRVEQGTLQKEELIN